MKKLMLSLILLGACASAQPSKIHRARRAYRAASNGPASKVAQEALLRAEKALRCAEQEHAKAPGSFQEQHCVYLTVRYAERARLEAHTRMAAAVAEQAQQMSEEP